MTSDSDVAVVFPGQGAQRAGMGRDFFDSFEDARRVFEEASDALALDLRQLCFEVDPRLGLTEYTQPALVSVEIAMFRVLQRQFGFAPGWFAGHSLGEYSALCAASVISLSDCVRLVAERGRLMQAAVPPGQGAMLAVLGPDALESITPQLAALWEVDLANLNAPDQVVLSGLLQAIQTIPPRLETAFAAAAFRTVLLDVSAPFHSRHMLGIEASFRARLGEVTAKLALDFAGRVASNYSGGFHGAEASAVVEALALQASHPVRWVENMRAIAGRASRIVELGPGRPLGRFFKTLGVSVTSITSVRAASALEQERPRSTPEANP